MLRDNKKKIIEMRKDGMKLQEIANIYNVTRQAIDQLLKGRKKISNSKYYKVLRRDKYICQWQEHCSGKRLIISTLCIHHVDLDISNIDKKNLITLCKKCHIEFHKLIKI